MGGGGPGGNEALPAAIVDEVEPAVGGGSASPVKAATAGSVGRAEAHAHTDAAGAGDWDPGRSDPVRSDPGRSDPGRSWRLGVAGDSHDAVQSDSTTLGGEGGSVLCDGTPVHWLVLELDKLIRELVEPAASEVSQLVQTCLRELVQPATGEVKVR